MIIFLEFVLFVSPMLDVNLFCFLPVCRQLINLYNFRVNSVHLRFSAGETQNEREEILENKRKKEYAFICSLQKSLHTPFWMESHTTIKEGKRR